MDSGNHLFFEGLVVTKPSSRAGIIRTHRVTPKSDGPIDEFCLWLFKRAGLSAEHYRWTSLNRRVGACLRALHAADSDDAKRRIDENPSLLRPALDAVLLGVTEFSRDPHVFQNLAQHIIPSLRPRKDRLRIWSAACSEGHELYSIAILLAENGLLGHCELLGTDCRSEAVERARAGVFSSESLSKLPSESRARFFTSQGRFARASQDLIRSLNWKISDLFAAIEPGPWDMILWRNMAIYLNADSADHIWRGLVRQLRTGGHLVVGKADHPPGGLGLNRIATCVYQKV